MSRKNKKHKKMKKLENLAKILFLFFAVISLSLVTVSCSDDDEDESVDKTELSKLSNKTWHLLKFVENGEEIYPVYPELESEDKTNLYNIRFNTNNTFKGKGYLNNFDGIFVVNTEYKKSILAHIYITTQAASLGSEEKMLNALQNVHTYSLRSNILLLYYGSDKYLQFEKID